jgi:hypothetical protein
VITNPLHGGEAQRPGRSREKGAELRNQIQYLHKTPNRAELAHAVAAIKADPPDAMVAFSGEFVVENRESAELNSKRLETLHELAPTVHRIDNRSRQQLKAAGCIGLGDHGEEWRSSPIAPASGVLSRTAYFVDRIRKGAKSEELPIERPTGHRARAEP